MSIESPRISLIVAVGNNQEIALNNDIPWQLSADLKNFKKITMGHTLLMGRKTYESIGFPLPGRTTLVMTRTPERIITQGKKNLFVVSDFMSAFSWSKDHGVEELFVAGGAEIYKLALPYIQRAYLTQVNYSGLADTFFPPEYDFSSWEVIHEEKHPKIKDQLSWNYKVLDKP